MAKDLYAVLELPKKASMAEVRKSYKRLARKYHPDLNPGDKSAEDKFKDISEAYATLSDPEKKKRYDAYGRLDEPGPQGAGAGVHFEGFNFEDLGEVSSFSDLYESFFRGASKSGVPEQGSDIVTPVNLTLSEAFTGKKVKLTIPHTAACQGCSGEGRVAPSGRKKCSKCGGSGKEGISKGPFQFARPCRSCGGSGNDPGDLCLKCGGTGKVSVVDKVEVSIPPGVDTGSKVRVKGKGDAGKRGGASGSLYVETHIEKDPFFEREGPNLRIKVPVTFPEAVMGSKVEIPTMDGKTLLKIPPGTKSGQLFRLRAKGMPSLLGGAPGDLLVEISIYVPEGVVDEGSKDLLREFERLNPENPRRNIVNGDRRRE